VQPHEYPRLPDRLYRFENLDGSGVKAEPPVDEDGRETAEVSRR
jgi:hypothetical protein